MLAGDLKVEAHWNLADLTQGPTLGSRASACGDFRCLRDAFLEVYESVSSSLTDLMSLVIRSVEPISRASIVPVGIYDLESMLSSNNTRIGELESQILSKNSELDAVLAELRSDKLRLCFAEGAVIFIREQVQYQGHQLRKVEADCVAAKAKRTAAEFNVKSLTVSESVSQVDVIQLLQ